jgi:hypothetical protein
VQLLLNALRVCVSSIFRLFAFSLDLSAISYRMMWSCGWQETQFNMTDKNKEGDNWGQLLSDFGIEENVQLEDNVQEEIISKEATPSGNLGAGLSDFVAETAEESSQSKEKKSIFSRFPKINFFGAPPEVSLDSVMEGVKSPSLGGKAFTDNKLEKMPISQERTDRQKKNRRQEEIAPAPDAWSAVASQIDVLASGSDTRAKAGERPARRAVSSMFDDPVPESEEFRKCKDLMEEQPSRRETHRESFSEEETDSRQRGRNRRKPQPEEREVRGRGSRYRPPVEVDDLPESDFEPMDDERPTTRGHGRRGSRDDGGGYRDRERIQDDVPQEEWSEVDAALQQANRGEPAQRGGRRQRYDKQRRPERFEESVADREPFDGEESNIVAVHGDVPSWDEAVGDIIVGNISRHRSHSGGRSHSGRGRR